MKISAIVAVVLVALLGLSSMYIVSEGQTALLLQFGRIVRTSDQPGLHFKLPLVQQAFRALVQELRPQDRVAIVVYAGAAGLVLPPTSGADKATILGAIDRLEAGGSTAGGAGIRLAYDVAKEHFDPEGNNRVILATDGDFNVGVSSDAEMVRLIEQRREDVAVVGEPCGLVGREVGRVLGERRAEVELLRDDRAARTRDDVGAHLREPALGEVRVRLVERVRDRQLEHAVAQELEPLVRLRPVRSPRRMRERDGRPIGRQRVDQRREIPVPSYWCDET